MGRQRGGKGRCREGGWVYIVTKCTTFTLWRLCGVEQLGKPPHNQSRVRTQANAIVLIFSKYLAKMK